jgi:hypothetical protein
VFAGSHAVDSFQKLQPISESRPTSGLHLIRERFDQHYSKEQNIAIIEQLVKLPGVYSFGDPYSEPIHRCTLLEYKERNTPGGLNFKTLGNMCMVLIYQYWEDHYRKKIAEFARLEKNGIKLPIMGDLGIIRNSIIHHKGIAKDEVEKCEILKWFKAGDEISVNQEQFEELIRHIEKGLNELSQKCERN